MTFLNRVFDLRPGDLRRGLPLFLYYFLIITFYMLGRTSRDSIFLDLFDKTVLPYADIAVAVLSSTIVAMYLRASRRANLRNLQIGTLLAFTAMLPMIWWGLRHDRVATSVVYYIWVGICGILSISQVWMLANVVWTTREAKRLFGLLGSGGIVGGIAAGFLTQWIATALGTDAILFFMTGLVLICAPVVAIIWKQQAPDATIGGAVEEQHHNLRESARVVFQSPHLRAIAMLILLGSVVTTMTSWQFKAIAKDAFEQMDGRTAFFGAVTGYTGILSLIAQLVLTAKLLRRFGVGVALLVLPLFLMAGSVAVFVWGTIWAATFLKGSDAVIRYSIDTSAIQLLYLPVPAKIKLSVKSFIDTVVWKVGDGLAGLTVLFFARRLGFSPHQISIVTIVLITVWIVSAVVARRQYVATLRENIQSVRLRPADLLVPTLDHATTNVLAEKLTSPDVKDVLYALELFEMGQRMQSHSALRRLLTHPSPHVRAKAVAILNDGADRSVRDDIVPLLRDDDLDVRTEALRYLTRHDRVDPLAHIEQLGEFPSAAVRSAAVAFLGRPGDGQNVEAAGMILDGMVTEAGAPGRDARLEAARLLASLPDQFEDRLARLLRDDDPDVAGEAVRTAGGRRTRRVVPTLIELLAREPIRQDAIDALTAFDEGVVGTLRDHLMDAREPGDVRAAILEILRRIGTPSAAAAIGEALLEPDLTLRFRAISALNKLQETRRDLVLDRQTIDAVMTAELMGHYRSYQLLGAQGGRPSEALTRLMTHEIERIFRLMKLLSPALDLKEAYAGVHSSDAVMHANALEFLDNTLSAEMRALIVPLLDGEVSIAERVKLADRFLGFSHTPPDAAAGAPRRPTHS
jgi:AAA family ATP:ADP antiporter